MRDDVKRPQPIINSERKLFIRRSSFSRHFGALLRHRGTTSLLLALLAANLAGAPAHARNVSRAAAAHSPTAQQTTQAASKEAILAPVRELYAALQQVQQPKSGTVQTRTERVGEAVDHVFDLDTILRQSIGLKYEALSLRDQAQLQKAFRAFTIARYVSSFKPGGTITFDISPQIKPSSFDNGTVVSTTIGHPNDTPTVIDYSLHPSNKGFRITDILLNGHISQVAAQRAEFRATILKEGTSGLIALFNRKTAAFLSH